MNTLYAQPQRVPLKWTQRAAMRLPRAWRSLFWIPRGCVPETRLLAQLAKAGKTHSGVTIRDVHAPPPASAGEESQPLFVAEVNPGKVVGDVSLVATVDDVVAGDIQGLSDVSEPVEHWRLQRCRYRPPARINGISAILAAPTGATYYHWLMESLPRLQLLEWAGFDPLRFDRFLLNEKPHRFHLETLDILRIPPAKRHWTSKAQTLECEHLVAPHVPAHRKFFPLWVASFLRERFLPLAKRLPIGNRLFISRKRGHSRCIANESEIESLLHRTGFKTVHLEDHSFAEQVGLFASASIIVAIHGSGLSNLVFAGLGAKVIELFAPTYVNHCYRRIAKTMSFDYFEVIGKLNGAPGKRCREDDMWISPGELEEALARAGI
jgi:capsular polysaccharide biosynthesis protein